MSIDLESALADLAQSVHDDGVTERMNGQVRHMVTRIRRRRAARYSATGVVGVGAAAAVVVGGLQLADRYPGPVPPAATDPTGDPDSASDGLSLECGDRVPADTLRPEWEGFRLELELGGPVAAGSNVPVVLRLVNDGDKYFDWDTAQVVQLAALRDGQIVATGTTSASSGVFSPDSDWRAEEPVSLSECAGEGGFGAGDYELVASALFANADGSDQLGLSAGPVPFTITEPQLDVPADDAASTIAGWLASPLANPGLAFPVCGTLSSDALDDGMPPLELDLVEPELTLASGSTYRATVRLHTTEGRYVIGNASQSATLVVLQDSVVVGYQWLDGEDVTVVDLADGQLLELPVLGTMNLCGTGEGGSGPLVPLPAGEYRIKAALDVMLKEIGEPGGEPEAITATMTAVSEAGWLTVTEP